jgi:Zn-dependent protease
LDLLWSMSSQFAPGEIGSIILAWVVLSIGWTYSYIIGLLNGSGSFEFVLAGFIATATGFILHEMGHKFVAIRRGYVAHFRVWTWGLLLTIGSVVASGGAFLFGAPGAVYIAPGPAVGFYGPGSDSSYRTRDPAYENMLISLAGPGLNLLFALGFLGMFIASSGFLGIVGFFGYELNVGLGSFNMLPVPPLDGSKIFRKSVPVALAIAIPLWGLFALFALQIFA